MTDAEFERMKGILSRWVWCWKVRLHLTDWTITAYYCRSAKEFVDMAPGSQSPETGGCCSSAGQYMNAAIYFNVERLWGYADEEELERVVCHELNHCVADELYKQGQAQDGASEYEKTEWSAHSERLVTHLTLNAMDAYHPAPVKGMY